MLHSAAVEGCDGIQWSAEPQGQGHFPAKTEAHRADLSGAIRVGLERVKDSLELGRRICLIFLLKDCSLVRIAQRGALAFVQVRGDRQIPDPREAVRDGADLGVEAPPFLDDDQGWPGPHAFWSRDVRGNRIDL